MISDAGRRPESVGEGPAAGSEIPRVDFANLFDEDALGQELFAWWAGPAWPDVRPHFAALGESGALATPLSARADREGPTLQTHDARRERVSRVIHHPDYRRLEELSYGRGIVAIKYEEDFLSEHRARRHLVGFGAAYYFAQTEMGLFCPICMTDGVARVLEKHGSGRIAAETIERLTTRDVSKLWQGAMFLTEKQGGSDVGSNCAAARLENGRWLLRGDKWFCSNAGAEAILTLARMPGGPPGTRGLGLFLVLRDRPEGNGRTIVIHRLKEKLGVRSMATGEITFEDTEGFLVGGAGEGFRQMAEMLNLSRLYNAVASVAAMRRAALEALAYGARREAFGRTLCELPLWRSTMADVIAETLGAFLLTFEAVRSLDGADGGDEDAPRLTRVLIPMAKILSGKLSVQVVSDAMEAIGGNAYVEESILPRLLRDCQVLPIWEGTSNILSLDVMRANRRDRAYEPFFARVGQALEAAAPSTDLAPLADRVRERIAADARSLETIAGRSLEDQQRGAREWVENAGRTMTLALLLEAAGQPPLRAAAAAAARRLLARPYAAMAAMSLDAAALADTEEDLLRAGYRGATDVQTPSIF
ncbi:MAG: acyl-CoA dehydrogenase family protein [Thermoanaerobaculia bacterium]